MASLSKSVPPGCFRAVTWNVYTGTAIATLDPLMKAQRDLGVSVFLMQEAGKNMDALCTKHGLSTYKAAGTGQRVAWSARWIPIRQRRVLLSDVEWYHGQGGGPAVTTQAAEVVLCDKRGRSLTALSYHLPPHTQFPEPERATKRYASTVDSLKTLGDLAADAVTVGWLAGGDDNWDETGGYQDRVATALLLGASNGLRQVQSPLGTTTFGKRQIDDFRLPRSGSGFKVGEGWVATGGGDHKMHGREFRWLA